MCGFEFFFKVEGPNLVSDAVAVMGFFGDDLLNVFSGGGGLLL